MFAAKSSVHLCDTSSVKEVAEQQLVIKLTRELFAVSLPNILAVWRAFEISAGCMPIDSEIIAQAKYAKASNVTLQRLDWRINSQTNSIRVPVETKGTEKNAIPSGTLLLCCSLNLHCLKCLAVELVDTEVPREAYEAKKVVVLTRSGDPQPH